MIKNIILGILFAAVAFLFYRSYSREKATVYISTPKLVMGYQGMINAQKEIENNSKVWKTNLDTLSSELQQMMKKFEKERGTLSEKESKLTQELMRTKQQQFMQYQQAMESKSEKDGQKMQEEVLAEINAFMKKYGESHNYEYIMGATNMGNIIYSKEANDITDEVLKKLNAQYKKE